MPIHPDRVKQIDAEMAKHWKPAFTLPIGNEGKRFLLVTSETIAAARACDSCGRKVKRGFWSYDVDLKTIVLSTGYRGINIENTRWSCCRVCALLNFSEHLKQATAYQEESKRLMREAGKRNHEQAKRQQSNGWLSPGGEFFACQHMGHIHMADDICERLHLSVSDRAGSAERTLEERGYLKVARDEWIYLSYHMPTPTQRQIDFIFDWARRHNRPEPTWFDDILKRGGDML